MDFDAQFSQLMAECEYDPYKFVMAVFPWGEENTELADQSGPRAWQRERLDLIKRKLRDGEELSEAIRSAIASGHGIGKSALVAWLILWAIATKVNTRGVVTANTANQLATKTWAEVSKWHKLFIGAKYFDLNATSLACRDTGMSKTWRIDAIPWSEDNTEAFAGLHNKGSRILVVFDEASAIDDRIWEVTEGALTDEKTQILWMCFGNPTRNVGRFRECFRHYAHRWDHASIDSRDVEGTNKKFFQQLIDDYGIDSDLVKIRVLGQFPNQSENTILSAKDIANSVARECPEEAYIKSAKVIGVDVAREGADSSAVIRRQGIKAWAPDAIHGADSIEVASKVYNHDSQWQADAVFLDGTGGYGGGVYDQCKLCNLHPHLIHFNSKADDPQYFNKRSEMIWKMCEWVRTVGCIPDDAELREELSVVSYVHQGDKIRIVEKKEMKKLLGRSPDKMDSLCLTFARDVYPQHQPDHFRGPTKKVDDWTPFSILDSK